MAKQQDAASTESTTERPYLVVRKPGTNIWRIVEPNHYIEPTEPGNFFAWAAKDHAVVEFHKGDE